MRRTIDWKFATAAYLDEGFLIPFLTPLEYLNLVGSVYGLQETEMQKRLDELAPFLEPSLPALLSLNHFRNVLTQTFACTVILRGRFIDRKADSL